jgi:hypothetical protein
MMMSVPGVKFNDDDVAERQVRADARYATDSVAAHGIGIGFTCMNS